jgi:hypothetical protein
LAGSAHLSSQSTPIISGGEDLGDMETRGKELAARCWDDNEEFLAKDKIAEWLGGQYVFSFFRSAFFCILEADIVLVPILTRWPCVIIWICSILRVFD